MENTGVWATWGCMHALLLPQLDGAPMLQVFQQAQELGFLVSLDVAYYPGPDWRTLRELLPFLDVFCPNIREAEAITGQSQPEAAALLKRENSSIS
jgi:sugar/nucleoside kinase (ribokinase family)